MHVQDPNHEGGLPPDSDITTDPQQDSTTTMPEINFSLNGLLKLLIILKPGKAAGPDRLKTLSVERTSRRDRSNHQNHF